MSPKAIIVICLFLTTTILIYYALDLPKNALSNLRTGSLGLFRMNGKNQRHQRLKNGSYLTAENQTIYSFPNVCIETVRQEVKGKTSNVRMVVVYDNYIDPGKRTISVAGSHMTPWNHWDIVVKSESELPKNITYRTQTAFFMSPTNAGNVFHFFYDEYIPLFSIMKISEDLDSGSKVQLVYRAPARQGYDQSRSKYECLLFALNADRFHDVFYNYPEKTCFRNGIFGLKTILKRKRDVVDYTLPRFNISAVDVLDRNNSVTVTFRRTRQILNINDLKTWAHLAGFKNVQIVDFENFSIRDQMKIASTTNVFIGVQGAALQWSMFMPEGSHLIEIAWPQKGWTFLYNKVIPDYGINCHKVVVTSITAPRYGGATVPHKWSDVIVKREEIFGALQVAYNSLFKSKTI